VTAAAALLGGAVAAFLAAAAAGPALRAWPARARQASYGLAAAGALAVTALGAAALAGAALDVRVPWLLAPFGLELRLDPLSGVFLLIVGLVGVPASVYAVGYLAPGGPHGAAPRRGSGASLAYAVFLLAMALVPLAGNVLTFLVAWELMALASYVLVLSDPDARGAVPAAWIYALVTHAGLACLLAGMLLVALPAGSDRFADWPAAAALLPPGRRAAAFVLLAVGFGSKAGLVPLHVWLPIAHPVAPSHVSALMSGAMIKLGVYGLVRAGFEWLGPGPPWWGVALLLAGAASALLGVLYALVEPDLKRVLAHSSVENVGIVVLGLGAGMVFGAAGLAPLAGLGAAAALVHAVNHAAFKGLLFLGAGAVLHATGTRRLEALGGLIHRMPWTAATFLVGAVAIAGLPPLNGFVGEWLVFQALLQAFRVPRPGLDAAFLLALGALALTTGLAVACFVRAFGIAFLALPRTRPAAEAREVGRAMRIPLVALAAACPALALGAPWLVPLLARATPGVGAAAAAVLDTPGATLAVEPGFAHLSPPAAAAVLAAAAGAVLLLLRLAGARRERRLYETWSCGRSLQTARMEYTAAAFAQPFKRVFAVLYRPVRQLDVGYHPESRLYVRTIRYRNPTRSLVEEWLYLPALAGARRVARRARRLQSGSASLYLAYVLATLLVLLALVALRPPAPPGPPPPRRTSVSHPASTSVSPGPVPPVIASEPRLAVANP
jgi:formate hydrogenlyase subunit 3/multisubunit Na+/H+ antiporter MnhD subunit